MADEKIVTSIVANSDFSGLIADVQRVTNSLHKLQQEFAGSNRALSGQIDAANAMFAQTMLKTGQFSSHFVSLTSDVEKFGRNLDSGRLKLRDYFRVYQDQVKTSGGLIRDLAKQQVQLQNAVLQPLGRNAQGLMQYNVHIPRGLDLTKNKSAILRQELQIMNKVIQDGGVQLINWGKNTQWAGRQLTVGLTLPLVAFGKAAADAFKVADQELTRLTKVYGDISGTSAQELGQIRKEVAATAKELSAAMGVNFSETIALAADIAATGKTGNELLSSVSETTRLAVLGEVDRQEAMKATLAIQSAFKQNTEELAETINFLNAVENQTSTTLNDLVEAIPKAGPVIKGLGGDVEDLALYLTAMREGGINASEGANALKSALASLINPTDVAVKKFQGFGIDLLGIVNKNAGSTTDTLFALQAALDRLNPLQKQQAIEQLFGKFQYSRLNALFENLGRQGSQTLQVLDLMKASASELESVANRELAAVTESAAGRYKRATESLRASLAGVGDDFLNIATKLINVLNKIIEFGQKLPDPIKKILAFGGAFTAIVGPVIMLTGVLANFFGYIIKGLGHFKALFKGAEGFKLLTPEIIAAKNASQMLENEFYSDAKAADTLRLAIEKLNNDLVLLQLNATKATGATAGLGQVISTAAGTPIMPVGGLGGLRLVIPGHPLLGGESRAAAHINPRNPNDPSTIFGLSLQPIPVNRTIGRTPQILMSERLPDVEGVTSIGGVSTGIVAGEHARYAALMATLGVQSKQEIEALKKTIGLGGQVSREFIDTFDDILPITQRLTANAATQSAAIVADLRAGKISAEVALGRIMAANAELERMLGVEVTAYAASRGRAIDLTKAPLIDQPVVDAAGKPNTRGMFRTGIFRDVMDAVGRATRTRTLGGPYSIETTRRLNKGGKVFYNDGDQVPGPNVNADVVPAMLTPGEFVIRRDVAQQDPDGMRALNDGNAVVVPINRHQGGEIPGVQYRFGGGGILSMLFAARSALIGGARKAGSRSRSTRVLSGANPERMVYEQMRNPSGTRGAFWAQSPLLREGAPGSDQVVGHLYTNPFKKLMDALGATPSKGSSPQLTIDQLRANGISINSAGRIFDILPNNVMTFGGIFNRKLGKGTATSKDWIDSNPQPEHFTGLTHFLLSLGFGENDIRQIREDVLLDVNSKVSRIPGAIDEYKFGNLVTGSIRSRLRDLNIPRSIPMAANRGGMVPGYLRGRSVKGLPQSIIDRITARWGSVYGGDSLSNQDPLHGPLSIGRYAPPRPTRVGRKGASIDYKIPGRTSNSEAFLTGSLEDRGRYVTQEYMLGNYDVLKVPGAIAAMKAWGKKTTGRFYRGIRLTGLRDVQPLPPWLLDDIQKARASGDYSGLIGKEFIMRRSSWSASPGVADEFGDFRIVADVRNRRVTPTSEMFPDIKFVPKSTKGKSKEKRIEAARSEEESVFGGKFRIVGADEKGLQIETVFGPLGGNRAFGGQVNAGTPYIVGENGPEVFVPKNSGGIVPGYGMGGNVYGYARGVQNRILGGGILPLLAMMGLPMAGQAIGSRVGGAAGSAISTGSLVGSMFMMPGMMRPRFTPQQRFGIQPPLFSGSAPTIEQALAGAPLMQMTGMLQPPIPSRKQSIFSSGGFLDNRSGGKISGWFEKNAAASNGWRTSLVRLGSVLTRTNVAIGLVAGAAAFGYSKWKQYQEGLDRTRLASGLTAESAGKLGLKFKNFGNTLKDTIAANKMFQDSNKAIYEGMTLSDSPIRMTITQYKQLRKEVKSTMGDQIDLINNTKKEDLPRIATQLKAMFVSAGMSAEEASKKIYMAFSISNKSANAYASTLGNASFKSITDASSAAKAAIETFSYVRKNVKDTDAQVNALSTAMGSITNAVDSSVKAAEKKAIKDKTYFNETEARLKAQKSLMQDLSKLKFDPIGEELLAKLAAVDAAILKIANSADTVKSLSQKQGLLDMGFTGNLLNFNVEEIDKIYNYAVQQQQKIIDESKKGVLKGKYKELNDLRAATLKAEQASRGESVKAQINRRDRIKYLNEEIKKINEAADARKKALQQEAEDQDINIEIQKKRLDYQQKLAMGDMGGAAQAQLDLQQLTNRQQATLTERAIEERRQADIAPYQEEIDKLNDEATKFSDAAALATEGAEKLQKKFNELKTTIDNFNKNLLAQILDKAYNNGGQLDILGAAAKSLGKALGLTEKQLRKILDLPDPSKEVTKSPDEAKEQYKKQNTPRPDTTGAPLTNKPKPQIETYNYSAGRDLGFFSENELKKANIERKINTRFIGNGGQRFYLYTFDGMNSQWQYKLDPVQPKYASGGYFRGFSDGTTDGPVSGPGTWTSDSILARLSNGEFVTRSAAVHDAGVNNMHLINQKGSAGILEAAFNIINRKDGGPIQKFDKGGEPKQKGFMGIKFFPGTASSMLDIAKGFLGYSEKSRNNSLYKYLTNIIGANPLTVNNVTRNFEKWCGLFISAIAKISGVKLPYVIGTESAVSSFRRMNRWKSSPQVGDLAFFDFEKLPNRFVEHVGLVESVINNKSVRTIEGNTSETNQSAGGRVARKVRLYGPFNPGGGVYTRGFGRPSYRGEPAGFVKPVKKDEIVSGVKRGYGKKIGATSTSSIASPTGEFSSIREYTAKRGDSLFDIAKANNIGLSKLFKANPTLLSDPKYHKGRTIFKGTKINIPGFKDGGPVGSDKQTRIGLMPPLLKPRGIKNALSFIMNSISKVGMAPFNLEALQNQEQLLGQKGRIVYRKPYTDIGGGLSYHEINTTAEYVKNPNPQTVVLHVSSEKGQFKETIAGVKRATDKLSKATGINFIVKPWGGESPIPESNNRYRHVQVDSKKGIPGNLGGFATPYRVALMPPKTLNRISFGLASGELLTRDIATHELIHVLGANDPKGFFCPICEQAVEGNSWPGYNPDAQYITPKKSTHTFNPFNIMFPSSGMPTARSISISDIEAMRRNVGYYSLKLANGTLVNPMDYDFPRFKFDAWKQTRYANEGRAGMAVNRGGENSYKGSFGGTPSVGRGGSYLIYGNKPDVDDYPRPAIGGGGYRYLDWPDGPLKYFNPIYQNFSKYTNSESLPNIIPVGPQSYLWEGKKYNWNTGRADVTDPIIKWERGKGYVAVPPKLAGGGYVNTFSGYVNPAYTSNMSMPSYYTGAKYVYDDTIAQLHKGEMVVPSAMNPNNPFATDSAGGAVSINNNLTIHAAPGMDTDELVNKVFTRVNQATSLALAKAGRTRSI